MKPQQKEKACSECNTPFKLFKSTDKFCSWECKKKHIKPNLKLKPLYKIPQKSKKRQIEDVQYMALRKVFLEKPENRTCPITGQPTTEVHHKYSGKDRGKYYLDVSTWMAISRDGHNWIHDNPKEAREKGYLY